MTLRHLKIFIAVAETRSMSAAARRCFITQPTVSQTIHELEEHYHTILFERLSRKLYITEAGKNLLSHARQVADQFDRLEQSMADSAVSQSLRIGATLTVGVCLLPNILNDFRSEMPQVSTYSCISNTADIEQKILDSSLDIGIVEGNIKSPDSALHTHRGRLSGADLRPKSSFRFAGSDSRLGAGRKRFCTARGRKRYPGPL